MIDKHELYKLFEDKSRFINNLPIEDSKKETYKNFFKSHPDLEDKIDWQNNNKQAIIDQISSIIEDGEGGKKEYKSNVVWENHGCEYLDSLDDVDYIWIKSYEGMKFCASAECGGAKADWYNGSEYADKSWDELKDNNLFVMTFNHQHLNSKDDLKLLIQLELNKLEMIEWDQSYQIALDGEFYPHQEQHYLTERDEAFKELEIFKKIRVSGRRKRLLDALIKHQYIYYQSRYATIDFNKNPKKYLNKYFEILDEEKGNLIPNRFYTSPYSTEFPLFRVRITNPQIISGQLLANEQEEPEKTFIELIRKWLATRVEYIEFDRSCLKYELHYEPKVGTAKNHLFAHFYNLKEVDLKNFRFSGSADNMFFNCSGLQKVHNLDLSKCTTASSAFYITAIQEIDASTFYNLETVNNMFMRCANLTTIKNPRFDKVKDASNMFNHCTSLKSFNLGNFNPGTNLQSIFKGCYELDYLDLSEVKATLSRGIIPNSLRLFGEKGDEEEYHYNLTHFIPSTTIPELNIYVNNATGAIPVQVDSPELPWSYRKR